MNIYIYKDYKRYMQRNNGRFYNAFIFVKSVKGEFMEAFEKNNVFFKIIKGVGISVVFTIVCLTVFSALLTYTNLSENLIQPVVISITGISVLVGSFFVTRKMSKNGIIKGISVGFMYILLIYLISSVVNNVNFSLSMGSIVMIIVGILCGAIGGIIGVNVGSFLGRRKKITSSICVREKCIGYLLHV